MTAPYAIVGELSADKTRIVLIAAGPDHYVAHAAKLVQLLTPRVSPTRPAGGLELPATWAAAVQLGATFGAAWQAGPRLLAWIREEAARRTAPAGGLTVEPPAGRLPRPYQVEAACMIAATGRGLILDEPGTGKTITTILGLVERSLIDHDLFAGQGRGPVLVVAPASVVDPWVEAWRTWVPQLHAIAWRGTPAKRRKLAGTADVYVTSYDTARMDARPAGYESARPLLDLAPRAVVIDECHLIKNPQAERSKAVRRLAKGAAAVVALSGTPITHHPGDLWPTLAALELPAWPSRERWVNRYCLTVPGDYDEQIVGLNRATETELRTALLGQLRRVAKADVLEQLPPKVYSVRSVELPPAYKRAYDDMEAQMIAELPDGGELSVMSVLAQLTRLSQLASAAAEVDTRVELGADGEERTHVSVTLKAPSWKVDALLEVLAERPGEPVVAFAPSRQLMMLAGAAATKAGHRVGYIVGGQAMAERTATVEAFQRGELDLLCATTGAGGVGLTLTAARTCVFLQRPWSLVEALQAEDRLHRIGAERHDSIEIVDIVARGTVDTRVRSVLREKAGQLADLVQDPRIVAELLGGERSRPAPRARAARPAPAEPNSDEDPVRIGSLCTGYGGLDMAVEAVFGGALAWWADVEPGPIAVMKHHHPDLPNLGDVKEINWRSIEAVDILTAGYPCQPFSNAGKRLGTDDPRHIWPFIAEGIGVLRPRIVVLENVAAHLRRGFDVVTKDLAALGYDATWTVVRASDVGAPHRRERLFIVAADSARHGRHQGRPEPAGIVGRSHAALGGDSAAAHPLGEPVRIEPGRGGGPRGAGTAEPGHAGKAAPDTDGPGREGQGSAEPDRRPIVTDGPAAWGEYAAAVERWERILGRPAPEPTTVGQRGERVLNPQFVEWMMGLPAGHVTGVDGLSRTQRLKLIGNGVVPQQALYALQFLISYLEVAA